MRTASRLVTADGVTGGDPLDQVEQADGAASLGAADSTVAGSTARGARWATFIGVAAAVIIVDQLSKAWLVANVAVDDVVSIIGDLVRLVQSQNSGALFGLFRDQAILFALVSVGVIGLIVLYHARSGRSLYLSVALGLLLGGAIGNMIDRLRLGYVVDWVDVGLASLRFWTFNVADSAITIAILMLIATALFPVLAGPSRGEADA
jgi:signal peptidase II